MKRTERESPRSAASGWAEGCGLTSTMTEWCEGSPNPATVLGGPHARRDPSCGRVLNLVFATGRVKGRSAEPQLPDGPNRTLDAAEGEGAIYLYGFSIRERCAGVAYALSS